MATEISRKRSLSIEVQDRSVQQQQQETKRQRNHHDEQDSLLMQLTAILAEIKSTPSSGEISAELLTSLRLLMLQIEDLSADESNTEAKNMKDESEKCLDLWLQDLVAQCEADGEDLFNDQLQDGDHQDNENDDDDDDDDDEEEDLALALALQDEEDYCHEVEKDEVCSKTTKEDEEDDIEVDII